MRVQAEQERLAALTSQYVRAAASTNAAERQARHRAEQQADAERARREAARVKAQRARRRERTQKRRAMQADAIAVAALTAHQEAQLTLLQRQKVLGTTHHAAVLRHYDGTALPPSLIPHS